MQIIFCDCNSLGLNYIQTFCLVKNTPLFFGDVVPQDNRNWNLLRKINVVFSPGISDGLYLLDIRAPPAATSCHFMVQNKSFLKMTEWTLDVF